ncbi:hypothetical protein DFR29_103281 [Tahibacter aquaticus]|uniref:Uncharacterized protein n=1 Tax=Tahibacter aquaticus TaxID=520092 RepID=A0A4R6Z4Y0_9GAMM|nr:hypothetical protein [Tahibacter aquaticus]TDR46745.1 hypothetical protein DFR29_103281 [Tahibacter aquaticus]
MRKTRQLLDGIIHYDKFSTISGGLYAILFAAILAGAAYGLSALCFFLSGRRLQGYVCGEMQSP